MAIIKHKTSHNACYDDVFDYYSFKHMEDSKTGHCEPILDEYGLPQERDNYAVIYIDSGGEEREPYLWADACAKTNLAHGKNLTKKERKSHEYIISHPASDREKMTMEDLMAEARAFAREFLLGYDVIIGAHRDTDNDHTHISIGSVRAQKRDEQPWMMRDGCGRVLSAEYIAGGKHQDSPALRRAMNDWLFEYTKVHGFEAKDNNATADQHRQERYGQKNKEMKSALLDCAKRSHNMEELAYILENDYGMLLKVSETGRTISVLYPGNKKYVRLRSLELTPEDLYRQLEANESEAKNKYRNAYREIRNLVWADFCEAQRKEFEKIKEHRTHNMQLYIENSDYIGAGNKRELHSQRWLKKSRYFELRAENDQAIAYHKERVELQRQYLAVAKERQQIVCALLRAGADEIMLETAFKDYREAMELMQKHMANPNDDFESRRLRSAQWSLEQARKRAELYIENMSNAEDETCEPLKNCETEYIAFVSGEQSDVCMRKSHTNNERGR